MSADYRPTVTAAKRLIFHISLVITVAAVVYQLYAKCDFCKHFVWSKV